MEGGGDGKEQKAPLRLGMLSFLKTLKQNAAEKQIAFDVVICGGRQKTFEKFRYAFDQADAGVLPLLLVDAEEALVSSPRTHLVKRDNWAPRGIDEGQIHLMTQVMETWIVADPEAVASYYKQGFVSCLPKNIDLEQTPKTTIEAQLTFATKQTQKGE